MNLLDTVRASCSGEAALFLAKDGTILNGTYEIPGWQFCIAGSVIMRFAGGKLDGGRMPAVEAPGFVAWMTDGRLNRSDGLPALCFDGFSKKEFWMDGIKV
jgi:hypothetical protein